MRDVNIAKIPDLEVDPVTLDIIESALKNYRHEMDAVLFRTAMSPVIREQHDEFPMICDPNGRMVVGQFGSYIREMMDRFDQPLYSGDVILLNDPYLCGGAISHINDFLVLVPIFDDDELIGWTSMFGHQMDVGGPLPGSFPTNATSIFGEGLRIPPVKLFEKGVLNQSVLDLILNNVRIPMMNRSDLMGIVAGCKTAEQRVQELCARFGKGTYLAACQALLDRTYRAVQILIHKNIPTEPQSFEDYIDDDGCGNGPYKMKLTIWREGDRAIFDWTGTDPQAEGPVNFYLNPGMFKMFIGVYLIMVYDPQILFNDGFYDLIDARIPDGSLLHPKFPAALGCRTHALARLFDVMGGCLGQKSPELTTAAGYGTSPHLLYSGNDKDDKFFFIMEIGYGGIPGRPIGDGMDGHSWWPLFTNIPTEYLESYCPVRVDRYASVTDSGGAGLHRGGNGIDKWYTFLESGEIAIHDDRWLTPPWGILGGKPGMRSTKVLIRKDRSRTVLPSKCDQVRVAPGDQLIFQTAGGGGWGDPLDRPDEKVRLDVIRDLVSIAKAKKDYGVVLDPETKVVDQSKTKRLRSQMKNERGDTQTFDFGPPLPELLENCEKETGLARPLSPPHPEGWKTASAKRAAA